MDIKLVDVTVHIDETLPKEKREDIEGKLRSIEGVVSVSVKDEKPHLMVVEYNPDRTHSHAILDVVRETGVHAELVGL